MRTRIALWFLWLRRNIYDIVLLVSALASIATLVAVAVVSRSLQPTPLTCGNVFVAGENLKQGETYNLDVISPLRVCLVGANLEALLPKVEPFPVYENKLIPKKDIEKGSLVTGRDFVTPVDLMTPYYVYLKREHLSLTEFGDKLTLFYPVEEKDYDLFHIPSEAGILVVEGRCMSMPQPDLCRFVPEKFWLSDKDGNAISAEEALVTSYVFAKIFGMLVTPSSYITSTVTTTETITTPGGTP